MTKFKVHVQLTEDALKDFKKIQSHQNSLLAKSSVNYLKKLIELPGDNWLELRQSGNNGVFKINDIIPFDIRGKVEYGPAQPEILVFVTHFKLKTFEEEYEIKKIS